MKSKSILAMLLILLSALSVPCLSSVPDDLDFPTLEPSQRSQPSQPSKRTEPSQPSQRSQPFTNSIGMKFVWIPPGTFMMGSPGNEPSRDSDETQHKVTLTKGFYMGVTEVTQGQWKAVMGSNSSGFKDGGDDLPVESVSWNDCQEFIRRLNQKEGGNRYRLPTEAEWEYACRAGSTGRFCFGDDEGRLGEYAWYSGNSGGKTHPVGQKKANAFGLHDMHGNVWEWCGDPYGDYPGGVVSDPKGPSSGLFPVRRGGSWLNVAWHCRSANRLGIVPTFWLGSLGFRLAGQ